MGASGSGVTTLGLHFSKTFNIPYLDSDKFFWEDTDPPFLTRRDPGKRNLLLQDALKKSSSWIIGGSIINWSLKLEFDLVVFLFLPKEIRLQRLKNRELERYGNIIYTNPERNKQFMDFMQWASEYDFNTARGRTHIAHGEWLKKQTCPVLELVGDLTVQERADKITEVLAALNG